MSQTIQLFLAIGLLITIAKTLGYVATRFGQPAVLGELIAGVLVGPSVFNILHSLAVFTDGAAIEHTIIEFAEIGVVLLGAAVVDDVLVILLMSLFIAVLPGDSAAAGESRSILEVVLRLGGFMIIGSALGWLLLPWIAKQINKTSIAAGVLIVAVVSALLFGVAAEFFGGIAAITGSFIAGVCLGRSDHQIKEKIGEGLYALNYGMFVPIFFVSIGLQANLRLLDSTILPFAVMLTLGAIISKIIGAGSGGLLTGFNRLSSLRLGVGMISRGEVGLIVATLGISTGIIGEEVFAAVVLVVLVTTVITPLLVRWAFAGLRQQA